MPLTVYWFPLSAPARSVKVFLETNKIEHQAVEKNVMTGETKSEEFLKINPSGTVPAIDDDGFLLGESATILRYLANSRKTPDHWYPSDPKKRAKVDEILDWHHSNLRKSSFGTLVVAIMNRSNEKPLDKEAFEAIHKDYVKSLSFLENKLKGHKFLTGDEITIADLLEATEVVFGRAWKEDFSKFPLITKWLESVEQATSWKDAHKGFDEFAQHTSSTLF